MKRIFISLLFLVGGLSLNAQSLRLPSFFSDGMVLQRNIKVPVWGWGKPGSEIVVEFRGRTVKTKVKGDGTWKVVLPKMEACPLAANLVVSEKSYGSAVMIHNVLVGDVFLCSGQSNMELPIRRCMDKVADNVKHYSNSQIRYLKISHQYNYVQPNEDMRGSTWYDVTPTNCMEMSAICYFMARELQEEKRVPIGIINSSVGGTRVESWMPQHVLSQFDKYEDEFSQVKYHQTDWPDSINRIEQRKSYEWEREMISGDSVVTRWRNPDYDFSSWLKTNMFADWSKGRNGSYWFRFIVDIDRLGDAVLRMGAMKDADSIFVNGHFVGNTTYEYPPRIYKVKREYLRLGDNEIMVHLMSQNGRPNFTRGKMYQLEIGSQVYKIPEDCSMAFGKEMSPKPSNTYFVDCPTGLYNAMIAPLRNFAFKGVLWYQGESNQGTQDYASYLEAMVKSWRKQFGAKLPVVIMQLPGFMSRHSEPILHSGWCDMRESQRQASLIISKSALASIIDTGEWNDIHPQDKHTAGHRAALQMRKLAYGERELVAEGPRVKSAKILDDGTVKLVFDDGQVKVVKESSATWSVYDENANKLVPIPIERGTNKSHLVLRYCYDDYPVPEIFGSTGIPAPQFEVCF
ncbi:MAG: sialate O-acetylesterase [Bacteroidaceae bacterium]|nr:sialate O-acetylesterase [Bacteroidaceae bacterium]